MPTRKITALFFICLSHSALGTQPIEVIPSELRGAVQPQAAIAPDGTVFVTFGRSNRIYCARSDQGELRFRAPSEIAALPKAALGMRRGPRIAASEKAIAITAISHETGDLYSWMSDDRGATWSNGVRVNDEPSSAREGMHGLGSDAKGNLFAVWLDLRSKRTQLWSATSPDGGKTWRTNVLVYQSPDGHICECCHPSIAVNEQGHVWAMWRNWLNGARDMYAAVSIDDGKTFSAGKRLGLGTWPLKACPMDGGSLAFTADGAPVTVWRREMAIYAAPQAGVEELVSAQGLQPVVAVGRGVIYYVWLRGSKLMLRKNDWAAKVFAEDGAYPAIAWSPARALPIVVWEGTTNGVKTIFAREVE